MSRKYLNDRWCVRCGRTSPSPYLQKNVKLLGSLDSSVLDIGCGNGRNFHYLMTLGYKDCLGVDMANEGINTKKVILGRDKLPHNTKGWNIILANYVFMFLDKKERKQLIKEIKKVASTECILICELYAAKDSEAKNNEEMLELQKELYTELGWNKVKYSNGRFIVRKN